MLYDFLARGAGIRFRSSTLTGLLSLLLSAAPALAQPPEAPAPALAFEESAVVIENVAPESRHAIVGVNRGFEAFVGSMDRFDGRVEAGEEGVARFELPSEERLSPRSVWAAVDLVSGDLVVGAPEGTEVHRIDPPGRGLGFAARFLEGEGRFLDVLLVRPEEGPEGEEAAGVWAVRAIDGGRDDRDGEANSRISLAVADLVELLESGPAPERLRPKDVLVGIEPASLRIFVVQLADGPEGE